MAEDPLLLKEDGYLNVDTTLKQIVYHPSLNVILICTDLEIVHVLDVNSGVVLQSSRLSGKCHVVLIVFSTITQAHMFDVSCIQHFLIFSSRQFQGDMQVSDRAR